MTSGLTTADARKIAWDLAEWAVSYLPTLEDRALADRALVDTLAVTLATPSLENPIRPMLEVVPEVARWSTLAHVLDYDDLHIPSTAHISAVCVPVVLFGGGGAREYLAGAGVMARLGIALGWRHYASGWHATCTTGAPAAAVAAALSMNCNVEQVLNAMLLAIPAAGGVQRAFGTYAKALQVGFAAEAGVRAARLAAAGATADPAMLAQWMELVGGTVEHGIWEHEEAIPGGLAVKLAPCCYAMQRPLHAARLLTESGVELDQVRRIRVRTPSCATKPLIHRQPRNGLQAKFSLEYAVAVGLVERCPRFEDFEDDAVGREAVQSLLDKLIVELEDTGEEGLLAGATVIRVTLADGEEIEVRVELPPGAPALPPTDEEFAAKVAGCRPDLRDSICGATWEDTAGLLRDELARTEPSRTVEDTTSGVASPCG